MKKFLKPLLLSLGGGLLMGTFCCNADAMKIQIPVLDPDPHVGETLTCNNCDSIAVEITDCHYNSYEFNIVFHDSLHPDGDVLCNNYYIGSDEDDEDFNYWLSHCGKPFFMPIKDIPNNVLNSFISSSSAFRTRLLIADSYNGVGNCHSDLAERQALFLKLDPDFEKHLDQKLDEAEYLEETVTLGDVLPYLKSYLQKLDANQLG